MKRLLMELEGEHPGVKQSMLKALSNVAPRHLLDTRLNPPAALRAEVRLKPDTTGDAVGKPDPTADVDEPAILAGPGRLLPVLR
jgi:hypothetical protein